MILDPIPPPSFIVHVEKIGEPGDEAMLTTPPSVVHFFVTAYSTWALPPTTSHLVHACKHLYNSYLTVIGVHEMHGRMHPNYCQITILLVVDPLSSSVYPMMTHSSPVPGNLPIKTLVTRQLPTNTYTCTRSHLTIWLCYAMNMLSKLLHCAS